MRNTINCLLLFVAVAAVLHVHSPVCLLHCTHPPPYPSHPPPNAHQHESRSLIQKPLSFFFYLVIHHPANRLLLFFVVFELLKQSNFNKLLRARRIVIVWCWWWMMSKRDNWRRMGDDFIIIVDWKKWGEEWLMDRGGEGNDDWSRPTDHQPADVHAQRIMRRRLQLTGRGHTQINDELFKGRRMGKCQPAKFTKMAEARHKWMDGRTRVHHF